MEAERAPIFQLTHQLLGWLGFTLGRFLSETDLCSLMPYIRDLRTRLSLPYFDVAVRILLPEFQADLQCFDEA
jgi:hypothetical protein